MNERRHRAGRAGSSSGNNPSGGEEVVFPWDRFSDWVHCICVVTFDLELGQALEMVYPGHAKLTEREDGICMMASACVCPEVFEKLVLTGCIGDTCFHFRMRRLSSKHMRPAHNKYNQRCPLSLQADSGYYFGFVYFRQVKDKRVPRGYLQKSVVLITLLPLVKLFSFVVETVAPEYFENGEPSLEAACHDLDQWSKPKPAATFSLPLMGKVVQCRIPSRFDPPTNPKHITPPIEPAFPAPVILPTVYDANLYDNFSPVIAHIQLLWELVILGEPLAVMAPSPTQSAGFVQSLVSLIWPLKYCLDYRPFFTIHDSEFKEYTSRTEPPPNVILGVTNPFFTKTLQHWPHVIRLGEISGSQNSSPVNSQKVKKGGDLRTLDNKAGVYTQYKPFLAKDKSFLKRLAKGVESSRPSEVQSAILRRHFLEITQSFMIPLERYIASLMPLQRQISPFKTAPKARQFDFDEFLSTLDVSGPNLTSGVKGDWIGLYRRFVQTVNFEGWFHQRQKEVSHKLQLLHLEVLCGTDFSSASLEEMPEVELVDLVLKLRDKVEFVECNKDTIKRDLRKKLHQQVEAVLDVLNDDLKAVLLAPSSQQPLLVSESEIDQ